MEILPIILGVLFGVALQRVGATNPENILNMLRFHDLHLMKAILFAIGLSSTCLFAGMAIGVIDAAHLSVKSTYAGVLAGGAILGVGFALSGYCPGTGLGAAAEGRRDGIWFVLGGLLGAALYMVCYAGIAESGLLGEWLGGKATLAQTGRYQVLMASQLPGWLVAGSIGIGLMVVACVLPRHPR